MVPLKASGVVWGCDVQYMLTGQTNQHPRTAIAFSKAERTDLLNILLFHCQYFLSSKDTNVKNVLHDFEHILRS